MSSVTLRDCGTDKLKHRQDREDVVHVCFTPRSDRSTLSDFSKTRGLNKRNFLTSIYISNIGTLVTVGQNATFQADR